MNTKYRTEAKNDFEKNNKKQSDIGLATYERTRNRFTSSINFKGSKYISDFLFNLRNKKEK